LSYTTFAYRNLKTSASTLSSAGSIDVSVVVKNTGRRAGDEVVQLYVRHLDSKVSRPLKELKDFVRIHLAPQEEKTVNMTLPASRLAYWNGKTDRWVVENDRIEITLGSSSADARLRKTLRVE
jgi:beta-glucosidase